ncbi:putative effector protein [Golovinomyces cichoracearum]|uniref:Putative effector protein n=1 Tax=Golovinomyces cichoracearum TaxID=62708 RepID=A0A420J383_9PEZI|nr:putative effector protein [Golovinomyces cichoracearum]
MPDKIWCAANQQPKIIEITQPLQKTPVTEQLVARKDPSNPNVIQLIAPQSQTVDMPTSPTDAESCQISTKT